VKLLPVKSSKQHNPPASEETKRRGKIKLVFPPNGTGLESLTLEDQKNVRITTNNSRRGKKRILAVGRKETGSPLGETNLGVGRRAEKGQTKWKRELLKQGALGGGRSLFHKGKGKRIREKSCFTRQRYGGRKKRIQHWER